MSASGLSVRSVAARVVAVMALAFLGPVAALAAAPPGPPFPEPVLDQAVYDEAGVFRPATLTSAEATIDAIEARTGAEVVVYSQIVDYGVTTEEADGAAQALIDQWGIGRKGFDDGLVIFFNLDPSKVHGNVILYGGPGYLAAFLDNAEKQAIFDNDMLPLLRTADLDGALLIALERVDANATPEHAKHLEVARQVNAAIGLVGAPTILFVVIGSALFAWQRYGRDPVYVDDPSVHMAGPPPDLTPSAATFVLAGHSSRRALTAAMLNLASRGTLSFRQESGATELNHKIGIDLDLPAADAIESARRARNAVRPLGPAEELVEERLRSIGGGTDGHLTPADLLEFGASVGEFDRALEALVVGQGWFREKPSAAKARWGIRGGIELILGIVALVLAIALPSSGLTLVAIAMVIGAVVVLVISRSMDAVTIPGAMIRAMLAAYRRTLEKTMRQARSMDEVVSHARLAWLETPDQAVVWGTALGLEKEVEAVLARSLEDLQGGRVSPAAVWLPLWYGTSDGGAAGGGIGGGSGGLLSGSAVPDFGGMMSALGTIGVSPSSSSSGGGGGFSGGSSGGGGGGSGGGF